MGPENYLLWRGKADLRIYVPDQFPGLAGQGSQGRMKLKTNSRGLPGGDGPGRAKIRLCPLFEIAKGMIRDLLSQGQLGRAL